MNDAAVSVGRMSFDRAIDVRGQRPESCATRSSLKHATYAGGVGVAATTTSDEVRGASSCP